MIITDVKHKTKGGKIKTGFYMNGYLKKNLDGIPNFLDKEWDVVGIVSGHGKVGTGKSTIAMQIAYYIAWMLAGGKMIDEEFEKGSYRIKECIPPNKEVRFGMENIVFTPEDLIKTAEGLYKKYGKHQVIVYDEGKSGLDSENAMKRINKAMAEFFQRCRVYGHIILVVLPNFFKLHEDYAVARSLFLVDVYSDKEFNRGFFNFYNEIQKERLFYFGKRLIGVRARYAAARESFWGKFTKWIPVSKKVYDREKMKNIEKGSMTKQSLRWMAQRNACWYVLWNKKGMSLSEIARETTILSKEDVTLQSVKEGISKITRQSPDEIQ